MTEVDLETRIVELQNDNRRLRRLLSPTSATRELRHRLSNTLAMLRIVIRRSADTSRDLESYVAHVEDRMNALARAQTTIDSFGEVELGSLFANELLQCGAREGERLRLSGPLIYLQPSAGRVLTLAAHELAANALEHGALTTREGRIEIRWQVGKSANGNDLELIWTESRSMPASRHRHQGFGHEVLMRMLPHELNGSVDLDASDDGLRYVIRVPFVERFGREEMEEESAATS